VICPDLLWIVYFIVLVDKLYWIMRFETTMMLVNLTTKLTVIVAVFLIDIQTPVMMTLTE